MWRFDCMDVNLNELIITLYTIMIKNTNLHGFSTEVPNQFSNPSSNFYEQSITSPLRMLYNSTYHQQKPLKKEKKVSNSLKNKGSNEICFKIIEQESFKNTVKSKGKHRKGKSMDFQAINDLIHQSNSACLKDQPQKGKKIIINSTYLQQMRKRNANSQMKYYNLPSKSTKNDEKNEVKKIKKKKSVDHEQPNKKQQKYIIQINSNYTIGSNMKKKHSKHLMKAHAHNSLTFSTKLSKNQQKSSQILQERRCKSSLRQKKNSKILGDSKILARSMPLSSKLNSLYSNTTSIYNSHNDLSIIQKKLSLRIPTQQSNEQIQQIRKYESLVLHTEKSFKVFRNMKHQNLLKSIQHPLIEPQIVKTEDIIHSYLQKFQTQSQLQIIQPATLDKINDIYNEPSINKIESKGNSIQNSLIENLQSISIDEKIKKANEDTQFDKLNEIIAIIQKRSINIVQQNEDKQYIIKTIKQILQKKKNSQPRQQVLTIEKYQLKQPKTKIYLDSNSLNTSSLNSSIASQADISVLNLQILDKALREREDYLQNRLKKQIEKIQEQEDPNKTLEDKASQVQRVTKWINHQIKEVHHTRTQLWKGFNVAKSILKDELSDKNKEMMRCLSEKYIHKNSHTLRLKKQKEHQGLKQSQPQELKESQQSLNTPISKNYDWSKLNDGMLQDEASSFANSPLIQQNPLRLEDLRFLTSNDSNQFLQSLSQSAEEPYDEPDKEDLSPNIIGENSSEKDERPLKRERLDCQSPRSDSQSESYGAIIIERQDTFLFSSQKKQDNKYFDISIEDKEDICEFLFLDLCIEINDDIDKNSKAMQAINRFIKKMKEQSKRQKGFKTNSAAIKEYLTNFITFLKSKPQLLTQIHKSLDKPMGPTAIQILRYMHSFNQEVEETESYILTAKIFDSFEDAYMRTIKLEKYYDDQDRQMKRRLFIKNAIHIHNKAIYDAYNESLDKDRPFGMWGQPFSWKKIAKFSHCRDTKAKNDILLKRAQQTIQYSNYMCGFMFDKQDCALRDNPNVTDAYIQQIRYDRLSQMMAKQLEESEERMQFFDDQETQILVDMGQFIFTRMVYQLCEQLADIL